MKTKKRKKIAVVGGRQFSDYVTLSHVLIPLLPFTLISGGARGADLLSERFADEYQLEKIIYKPNWDKYGRAAGFIRNSQIISDAEVLVAFWDGTSKGTKDSIDRANKKNIPVITVKF